MIEVAVWATRRGVFSRIHLVEDVLIVEDESDLDVTYCGRLVPEDALREICPWGGHDMDHMRQVCLVCGKTRQYLVAAGEMPLCIPSAETEKMCRICVERVGLELATWA